MHATDERFADIQMLRYHLDGFSRLTLQQKLYIYYLGEATLWGRDIAFDQHCRHNLTLRRTLEAILRHHPASDESEDYAAFITYLKQVWFAGGMHHHYGNEKFTPGFSVQFLKDCIREVPESELPLLDGETVELFSERMERLCFDPHYLNKRVNLSPDEDLVTTSACNFYQNVTQAEAEAYYQGLRASAPSDSQQPSWGLNSTLVKRDNNNIEEDVWRIGGRYSELITRIVDNLLQARQYADNDGQRRIIDLLVDYYRTGDLQTFDRYSIEWVKQTETDIDFINGFIEVYGDPLGIKATWEGIVHYVDTEATRRTQLISRHAQWFEDHSPVSPRFRKTEATGISAKVVRAAMLGGDEYPATAIGINLPNAEWIRATHGSKSIRISNIIQAYNVAAQDNGLYEEFIPDEVTREWIRCYNDVCDDLHTDLHECVGHGSGKLLPHTDPGALKAYGSTIEEARADLFALYFMADPKIVQLGLLPHPDAYKAQYYTYLLNGLMTQLARIKPGHIIEESHMRNRALIARWLLRHAGGNIALQSQDGKTTLHIADYRQLRTLIAELLAEVQRIKSEGDYLAAKQLVEDYGTHVDEALHKEVRERYARLNIAPYKGFINPRLQIQYDHQGNPVDVTADYTETYTEQMLRYSRQYSLT